MKAVHQLEKQLEGAFKDLPALPKGAKDTLVQIWPYLALILGLVQLLAAGALWGLVSTSNRFIDYANQMSQYTTGQTVGYSATDKMVIYVGLVLLVVNAVIFLMAYPPLTKHAKKGWDLLFLASLINVIYAVVQIFISSQGIGSFIMSIVGSAIGFYLLFQIRDRYHSPGTAKKT